MLVTFFDTLVKFFNNFYGYIFLSTLIIFYITIFALRMENKIWIKIVEFIFLCFLYTPFLLFTLFVIGISGMAHSSCKLDDIECLIINESDAIYMFITILAINILFWAGLIYEAIKNIKLLYTIKGE